MTLADNRRFKICLITPLKSASRQVSGGDWASRKLGEKARLPVPILKLPPMDMTQFRCGRKTEGLDNGQTG